MGRRSTHWTFQRRFLRTSNNVVIFDFNGSFPCVGSIKCTRVKTLGTYFVQGRPHDSEISLSLLSQLVDLR